MGKFKHGFAQENGPLYRCWLGISRRCYNKKDASYKNYGGRGIFMCPEWRGNFPAFRNWAISNGWAIGLTIERKEVDKEYSPQNCTWATRKEQNRNKRNSKLIEFEGQKLTSHEWAAITGISSGTIRRRICKRGWDIKKALTTPPESAISSNKITETDALLIYNSDKPADELAKIYSVSRATVWSIWRGDTWSHVTLADSRKGIKKRPYHKAF